jgi:predicted transcriptional regulator
MKKMLSGVKVKDLMTRNVITVAADMPLDKLVDDYFFRTRHATFPVVEDDKILGLVILHDIKEVPRAKWPQTPAKEVLIPLSRELVIGKDVDVMLALTKLASNRLGRLLVVEDSKLLGILSQRDIMRLFEFKSEIEGE